MRRAVRRGTERMSGCRLGSLGAHHVDELTQLELDAHGESVADVEHGPHELVVVAEQVVVQPLGVGVGGAAGERGQRGQQQQRGRGVRRGTARHLRPRMASAHRAATARRLPALCVRNTLHSTLYVLYKSTLYAFVAFNKKKIIIQLLHPSCTNSKRELEPVVATTLILSYLGSHDGQQE